MIPEDICTSSKSIGFADNVCTQMIMQGNDINANQIQIPFRMAIKVKRIFSKFI
jgi:hypothetical protein